MAMEMNFATKRKLEDATLCLRLGIRTRADCREAAAQEPGSVGDVTSPAGRAFDAYFCAAARHYGADICGGCGHLTIETELNSYRGAPSLCNECDKNIYEAVCGLPAWVKDRDLPEVIPALVRAFVRTAKE